MRAVGRLSALVAGLVVLAGCAGSVAASQTSPPAAAATDAHFLQLAEQGIAAAKRYWWNPKLGWYDARLPATWNPHKPLARLWDAYPLFETIDAVAIASPTPAHLAAVRAYADGAERYYNPNLQPVGGYDWYLGTTDPKEHTYFDDNGWFEIAFLDAYRATGSTRYLRDAERAFRFIDLAGWDAAGGGVWWETEHLHRTSEPLAAEIYGGLDLYELTGQATYLQVALRFLNWANANSWNQAKQLYSRNSADQTVLDYVQGMMIGAHLELCRITGEQSWCEQAEQLATASLAAFTTKLDWTPAADAIYLRFVLDLYDQSGKERWYALALANAQRALKLARGWHGLFLRHWNGKSFPTQLLQPEAATSSVFAWLAVAGDEPVTDPQPSVAPMPFAVPATLVFAPTPAGTASRRELTVTNTSPAALTVTGLAEGPLGLGESTTTFTTESDCPASLASGASCQIEVTFAPKRAADDRLALDVESASGGVTNPPAQVMLEGRARPAGSSL